VTGLVGRVSKATVVLNGLSHTFPHDVNVLLASPAGTKVLVMSHTGGGHAVTNITLTFDDTAAGSLANYDAISTGLSKPTSYEGPVTLPGTGRYSSYVFGLSNLNWTTPNGTWSLYVYDDAPGDSGNIAGGWNLNLTTLVTVGPVADLAVGMSSAPAPLYLGNNLTNTITITNLGPDWATGVTLTNPLPAGVSFDSAWLSQGSVSSTGGGAVVCSLGNLPVGGGARVMIVTAPSLAGTLINAVVAAASEEDLNPANNAAQTTVKVLAATTATLQGSMVNGQFQLTVSGQANVAYVIQASTNLTSWVSLSTNTASTSGTISFTDTESSGLTQRFYRTKLLTP